MKKEFKILIIFGVLGLVALIVTNGRYVLMPMFVGDSEVEVQRKEIVVKNTTTRKVSSGRNGGAQESGGISFAEFEKHNRSEDCWVLIDGSIYDISRFIAQEPVHEQLASQFCGTIGFQVGFLGQNKIKEKVIKNSRKRGNIK